MSRKSQTVTMVYVGEGRAWAVGAHSRVRYTGHKIEAHPRDVKTLLAKGWKIYEPPLAPRSAEAEPSE
ncbi:hypothetical protein HC928_03775 [bacterium]|nr:hypothetical protein [bacterium]